MSSPTPLELRNRGAEPTEADLEWWRDASKPERRRYLALWIPWIAGIVIIPSAIKNPHAFFGGRWLLLIPLGIACGIVGAVTGWRLLSPSLLKARLTGKRIRDALLESGSQAGPS